jgi:hydroxymethylpyrimidine/phosphomethylpyrimidine kinase
MSVIVSVVAENTSRVISIRDIESTCIKDQIDAIFEDISVDAVKVGMLSGIDQMNAVATKLAEYTPSNVVIDPVMVAKGGCALMQPESLSTLKERIIPLADILTPNIPEAEVITGHTITSHQDMIRAARSIHRLGASAVLIKGGHLEGDAFDLLFDGTRDFTFSTKRINTKNTHGTGCTLSSAITAYLAKGYSTYDSVRLAKDYITTAIEHSLPIGKGHGPTNHFYQLYKDGGIIE